MSVEASGRHPAAANKLSVVIRYAAVVTGSVAAAVVVSGCGSGLKSADAAPDVPACTLTFTADYGAIQAFDSTQAARTTDGSGKQTIAFLGALASGGSADTLDIQLIQGMGAFANGPPAAGTYSLTGAEAQLSTCGVCVVIDGGTPRSYFAAQSGTLVIEDASTRFKASLSNVKLDHVDVDPNTSVSTIVDTCQMSVTSASWDTPIN